MGPTVLVPPKHMMAPSSANEVATAMATARQEIETLKLPGTPPIPAETLVTDKFAFAFDIDGVLIRGGKPIPEAIEAMKMLNGANEYALKVYVHPIAVYHAQLLNTFQTLHICHQRGW